jgi:uncharacterized protein CbrC (UPF0167 family)
LVRRAVAGIGAEHQDLPAATLGVGKQAVELAALLGKELGRRRGRLDAETSVDSRIRLEDGLVASGIIADQHAADDDATHSDDFPGVKDPRIVVDDRVERLTETDPGFELGRVFGHERWSV